MARAFPREHLQPVLLDRLQDDVGSVLDELKAKRKALAGRLDPASAAALDALIEALPPGQAPRASELAPFADLDPETRQLLGRVVELEQSSRLEVRRSYMITMDQLRASVLRELVHLFNTQCVEDLQVAGPGGPEALLDGLPRVRDSVLNYGMPALAGRIRTPADLAELARAVERTIQRFEPRLSRVRVSVEGAEGGAVAEIRSPVALVIEGDLWGHPVSEPLRLRTVLDLERGDARVEAAAAEGR